MEGARVKFLLHIGCEGGLRRRRMCYVRSGFGLELRLPTDCHIMRHEVEVGLDTDICTSVRIGRNGVKYEKLTSKLPNFKIVVLG